MSQLRSVTLVVQAKEAVAIVQCLRMVTELLHQDFADYGADGVVKIDELRHNLIIQVEQQRTKVNSGHTSAAPRE